MISKHPSLPRHCCRWKARSEPPADTSHPISPELKHVEDVLVVYAVDPQQPSFKLDRLAPVYFCADILIFNLCPEFVI